MRAVVRNGIHIHQAFFEGSSIVRPDEPPTITLARANGEELEAPEAQIIDAGEYVDHVRITLQGDAVSRLDELTITWTAIVNGLSRKEVSFLKVVGQRYFQLHELRAMEGLTSHNNYSDADLEAARLVAESRIENFCETSFVPQARIETHDAADLYQKRPSNPNNGFGFPLLHLRRSPVRGLISVKSSGNEIDTDAWTVTEWGQLRSAGAHPNLSLIHI